MDKAECIFSRALELDDPDRRLVWVKEACGDDPELADRVTRLLRLHQTAEDVFPSRPSISLQGVESVPASGTTIDRYRLLEQIGEGGFGVVYMAEQEKPVRRKVALKIIKLGMDTRQVIARFEAERQALAMMDHPNIAKVHDAGATETGRPYFVMELVRGIPITQFCEENRLTIKERLQLFIPVCQAIQHAHQKGVIHRDIKPTNCLVTMNEGVPHPMVIDFGVAKAIDQRLTEKTLYTRFAQMIGTPAYMSPEQAEMSKQDVDTRTDVYSLGILLYELLTGTTPFPEDRLRKAGYAEIQRIISQEEPVRPSTLLSRLNGRSRSVAASRRCEPESLLKLIKGDLDWIVLKAIDKDRSRRYETTNGLAADLQRHLSDEPVTATPPSRFYRFQKFVHRNRVTTAAGIAIAVSLLLGTIISTAMAIRAEKQKAAVEALNQWVTDKLLANPYVERGERISANTTYAEVLIRASQSLDDAFTQQPEVEAILRFKLGDSLAFFDKIEEALPHLRRAHELARQYFGETDVRTLAIQEALANHITWFHGGYYQTAQKEELGEEGMRLLWQGHGKCTQHLGPGHPLTLLYKIRLAYNLMRRGDRAQAETLLDAAAPLIQALPDVDRYQQSVFRYLTKQRMRDHWRLMATVVKTGVEARRLRLDVLEDTRERRLASDRPGIYTTGELQMMLEVGWTIKDWDRDIERAKQMFSQGAVESRKLVGESHPTPALLHSLAVTYLDLGEYDRALAYQRDHLAALETTEVPRPVLQGVVKWAASTPARLGDWKPAADELETHREQGYVDLESTASEALLRLMEGNDAAWQTLLPLLAEQLEHGEVTDFSLGVSEVLLVSSALKSEIPGLDPWIENQLSKEANVLKRAHINALVDFLKQRWQAAMEAAPVVLDSRGSWKMRAALMGYLTAISHHHLGNATEASRLVGRSDAILEGLLQTGDLTEHWQVPALCLLARGQAHEVVLGVAEEPVDSNWLESKRTAWKPVKALLEKANERARRQDYQGAARIYRQILSDPSFRESLEAFNDLDIRKMALAFVLTDATEDYVRVCQQAYAEVDFAGWHVDHWPLSFLPDTLPEELKSKLQSGVPIHVREKIRHAAEREEPYYDNLLMIGLVCSQLGLYADASLALEVAMQDPDNPSASLLARALHAKGKLHLGDTEEAQGELREVQGIFTRTLTLGEGRMDPDWTAQSMTTVVLQEQNPNSK